MRLKDSYKSCSFFDYAVQVLCNTQTIIHPMCQKNKQPKSDVIRPSYRPQAELVIMRGAEPQLAMTAHPPLWAQILSKTKETSSKQ